MKEIFQAKLKNKVGLDIGNFGIKMLEITGAQDRPALIGLGLKNISGLSKEGIASSIKDLAVEAKISSKEVNISVSGPSVIIRFISMPKMKEEDLKSAIKFEAEKFIPFDIKDCIIDSQILARDDRENKLNILLVAAKKDYIDEKIKQVEQAGFSVAIVDVAGFALANSFLRNFQSLDPNKTFALLNIGATITNLSILHAGVIAFARDVAIGSGNLSTSIAKNLNIPIESAEKLKISPGEKAQGIVNSVKPVMNTLLDDLKLSFGYYENQSGRGIDEIYISGGGARTIGLDETFQDVLGSKPTIWNPLEFLDASSSHLDKTAIDSIKNSFAISAGLAAR